MKEHRFDKTQAYQKVIEEQDIYDKAKKLANVMPTFGPDRLIYIRNLLTKTMRGEIDKEVFTRFIKITNSWIELESCAPRAKSLLQRRTNVK